MQQSTDLMKPVILTRDDDQSGSKPPDLILPVILNQNQNYCGSSEIVKETQENGYEAMITSLQKIEEAMIPNSRMSSAEEATLRSAHQEISDLLQKLTSRSALKRM